MHLPEASAMKELLLRFIMNKGFPCVMAKSVAAKGMLVTQEVADLESENEFKLIVERFHGFIDEYRKNPGRLSSFIVLVNSSLSFENFEAKFWRFLKRLHTEDKLAYRHDPRVSSVVAADDFSFSIKEEAFFILALHPESPRFARRFSSPAIVFNPHQQFENLRKAGIFERIKNLIRKRDINLQGSINPMLSDFGARSEIYQYMGRVHPEDEVLTLTT